MRPYRGIQSGQGSLLEACIEPGFPGDQDKQMHKEREHPFKSMLIVVKREGPVDHQQYRGWNHRPFEYVERRTMPARCANRAATVDVRKTPGYEALIG